VFARIFDGAGEAKRVRRQAVLHEPHPALGNRAGLVEDDRADAPRVLQDLRSLDQDSQLSTAPRADHECRRRRETESAGAGDDQYGNGGGDRLGLVAGSQDPTGQRGERDSNHDGYEHS
jgi:hypothetical protein